MVNTAAQIRYLIQWFNEWSDLQRSDFLPILAEKYTNKPYVNGLVNTISNVNCREKPMSLFECRVKLFREWFIQWTPEQKEKFLTQISEIDENFTEKLNAELRQASDNNFEFINGDGGVSESQQPQQQQQQQEAQVEN